MASLLPNEPGRRVLDSLEHRAISTHATRQADRVLEIAFFKDFHPRRYRFGFGFEAGKQMNVVRHDHVSADPDSMIASFYPQKPPWSGPSE
jgi:hypothetical protein